MIIFRLRLKNWRNFSGINFRSYNEMNHYMHGMCKDFYIDKSIPNQVEIGLRFTGGALYTLCKTERGQCLNPWNLIRFIPSEGE